MPHSWVHASAHRAMPTNLSRSPATAGKSRPANTVSRYPTGSDHPQASRCISSKWDAAGDL